MLFSKRRRIRHLPSIFFYFRGQQVFRRYIDYSKIEIISDNVGQLMNGFHLAHLLIIHSRKTSSCMSIIVRDKTIFNILAIVGIEFRSAFFVLIIILAWWVSLVIITYCTVISQLSRFAVQPITFANERWKTSVKRFSVSWQFSLHFSIAAERRTQKIVDIKNRFRTKIN